MATVFAYKGILGINGWAPDAPNEFEMMELKYLTPALINNPLEPGQLGFVCLLEKCSFTQEAIDFLKTKVVKSNDDIGEVDIFGSEQGPILAWLGGPIRAFKEEVEGSNSYDPSFLDNVVPVEMELDPSFVEFVDNMDSMNTSEEN